MPLFGASETDWPNVVRLLLSEYRVSFVGGWVRWGWGKFFSCWPSIGKRRNCLIYNIMKTVSRTEARKETGQPSRIRWAFSSRDRALLSGNDLIENGAMFTSAKILPDSPPERPKSRTHDRKTSDQTIVYTVMENFFSL